MGIQLEVLSQMPQSGVLYWLLLHPVIETINILVKIVILLKYKPLIGSLYCEMFHIYTIIIF